MDLNGESPVWHPFTQMLLDPDPMWISKAEGAYLFDRNGRSIIDAISSWWVTLHGHAHPKIAEAIARQAKTLEQVIFAGFTHEPAERLARKLVDTAAMPLHKVFYSDNGSTSVEVAIKMALQYQHNRNEKNRTRIIALEGAYHGDTFGSMSVSARNAFNAPFEKHLFEVDFLPFPSAINAAECLEKMNEWAKREESVAFIYEPLVQGAAGMQMYDAEILDQLLGAAKSAGLICIADEVMTGFGRTETIFASQAMQHKPDILCLSKGITGGFMPLGATLCTEEIYRAFLSSDLSKTFFHGHSYTANPLACAAANASLDLLLDADCEKRRNNIMQRHAHFIRNWAGRNKSVELRQCGTILACELKVPEGSNYFSPIRDHLYHFAMVRGVLLRPLGNVVYTMPPFEIGEDALSRIYEVLEEIMAAHAEQAA